MLEILRIKNLALIEDMELEFHPGLNVLTGESGAGKSFILKALDFIMGEKIQAAMVRPGRKKALVEAMFVVDDQDLILRRELAANTGRSRFFLNDSLSSQEKVQSLRDRLLIHTSQHGQQKLLKPGFHSLILDSFLPDKTLLDSRNQLLTDLHKIASKIRTLKDKMAALAEKRDYLEFQRSQIEKVKPRKNEEEELTDRRSLLKTRAETAGHVENALNILHGPGTGLGDSFFELKKTISTLAEHNTVFARQAEELENVGALLEDIDMALRSADTRTDAQELESLESRLWELAQLRRKLNRSLDEIFCLEKEINDNISFLDQGGLTLKQLERQEKNLADQLVNIISKLEEARQTSASDLKTKLENELRFLGFSEHVRIDFEFKPEEIYPGIFENRIRLLWVPNPGQPAQPLDRIASGGELSRFLLALVGLRSERDLPTLLFDEVDSGIGGTILNQVGSRIRSLAEDRQVILITHWAQLACLAQKHFQVQKNVFDRETYTLCRGLSRQESRQELARMVGGDQGLEMVAGLQHEAKN